MNEQLAHTRQQPPHAQEAVYWGILTTQPQGERRLMLTLAGFAPILFERREGAEEVARRGREQGEDSRAVRVFCRFAVLAEQPPQPSAN